MVGVDSHSDCADCDSMVGMEQDYMIGDWIEMNADRIVETGLFILLLMILGLQVTILIGIAGCWLTH